MYPVQASPAQKHGFIENTKCFVKEVASQGLKTALSSGTHALAATLFSINPVAGAIVGGTSYLTSEIVDKFCEKTDIAQQGTSAKTAKWILSATGGIALGAFVANAVGFPITFSVAALLSIGTSLLVTIASIIATLVIVVIFGAMTITFGGLLLASSIFTPQRHVDPQQRLSFNI